MKRFPLLTVTFVLVNLLAYGLELAGGVEATCYAHGLVPAHVEPAAVLASLFLHASPAHLAGNLIFLAVFGAVVERELGSVAFLVLYLAAGVAGALLHVAVAPTATEPLVGCSGCLFGVMAVAAVLRPRLIGFIGALAVLNIWFALAGTGGEVSFGCHIGGLAAGCLFAAAVHAARTLEVA